MHYVDTSILVALRHGARLLTLDDRLLRAAQRLGIAEAV